MAAEVTIFDASFGTGVLDESEEGLCCMVEVGEAKGCGDVACIWDDLDDQVILSLWDDTLADPHMH
jgi:hypothetical protein